MSKDLSSETVKDSQPSTLTTNAKIKKSFSVIIGAVSIFFIGQFVGVFTALAFYYALGFSQAEITSTLENSAISQFLVTLLIELITVGLIYWLNILRKSNFFAAVKLQGWPKLRHFGIALLTYGLYFLSFIVLVMIINNFIPTVDTNQVQQLGFTNQQGTNLIFVFLTLVILPAVAEEILFRGYLFQKLRKILDIRVAAVITSLIFGLAHLEFFSGSSLNWIAAADTTLLSLFLIRVYVKTDSLWTNIFLHGIKNTIAFVVLFII